MSGVRHNLHVLRYAVLTGYYDYQVMYTWKTWLAGWYLRVLAQVAFFALIGELLGSREKVEYLLVGNAVLLATIMAFTAIASSAWERWTGTLPLLVAAPSSHVVVFAGRSLSFVVDGIITSLAAFFVAAAAFGVALPWPRVLLYVPLVAVVALSSYAFAIFLGGWVVRAPHTRNVVSNVSHTTILAIGGVTVPLTFFPQPVQWLAHALPVTHGLDAIRDVLAGEAATVVLANVGAELGIGLGWLLLAVATFEWFGERGRRDGSIEFAA